MPDSQEHFKKFAAEVKRLLGEHNEFADTGKNIFLETYTVWYRNLEHMDLLPKNAPTIEDVSGALDALEKQVERINKTHSPRETVIAAKMTIARLGAPDSSALDLSPLSANLPTQVDFRHGPPYSPLAILTAADALIGHDKQYHRLDPIKLDEPLLSLNKEAEEFDRREATVENIMNQIHSKPDLAARFLQFGIYDTTTKMILNANAVIRDAKRQPKEMG